MHAGPAGGGRVSTTTKNYGPFHEAPVAGSPTGGITLRYWWDALTDELVYRDRWL